MKFMLRLPATALLTLLAAFAIWLPCSLAQSPSPAKPGGAGKTKPEPGSVEATINVDGDVSDWKGIEPAISVPAKGSQPCDWRKLFLFSDKTNLFLRYTTEGAVDFTKGAAYMVFLDTDQSKSTGFRGSDGQFSIGADFLLQGTTLYKYTGTGTDWSWQSFGTVPFGTRQNEAEFSLKREQIGKPAAVDIILYGDNEAGGVGGTTLDVVPADAVAGKGKITYRLK